MESSRTFTQEAGGWSHWVWRRAGLGLGLGGDGPHAALLGSLWPSASALRNLTDLRDSQGRGHTHESTPSPQTETQVRALKWKLLWGPCHPWAVAKG